MNGAQLRDRLDAAGAELVEYQRPGDFEDARETHVRILRRFATALDLSYLATKASCDFEHGPFLIVGGFFVRQGRSRPPKNARHDHVQVVVSEGTLFAREGVGLVAAINELHLPEGLQGRGLGRCLLNMFCRAWCRLGVEELQAAAVSEAGRAAFPSWGFREGPNDVGLQQYWLPWERCSELAPL